MIKSPAVRKFIMDYFIEHGQESIGKMAMDIHRYLSQNLVMNEMVFSKRLGLTGKVVKILRPGYIVAMQCDGDGREDVFQFTDLGRNDEINASDIGDYIIGVTMETPFGRVLRENAFESIRSPGVPKRRIPTTQGHSGHPDILPSPQASVPKTIRAREIVPPRRQRESSGAGTKRSKGGDDVSKIQGERGKGRGSGEESKEWEKTAVGAEALLGLDSYKVVRVKGFESHRLESLMKLFSFLSNFKMFFKIREIEVEELAEAIAEPGYESKTVFKIHSRLVRALEDEIDRIGMGSFRENIKPALMVVEEKVCSMNRQNRRQGEAKKNNQERTGGETREEARMELSEKSWKSDVKEFVCKVAEGLSENVSVLTDSVCTSGKTALEEQVDARLSLMEFLLHSFFVTDTFRNMISEKMSGLKSLEKKKKDAQTRLKEIRSRMRHSADEEEASDLDRQRTSVERELASISGEILQQPLRVSMGCIDGIYFLNIDRKMYGIRDGVYYLLPPDVVANMCRNYVPRNKAEKNILSTLLQHVEILQSRDVSA